MPASFLHGVETIYQNAGGASVSDVPTAVIGIIGTAPKGLCDTPVLVTSDIDGAAKFGTSQQGYTIPYALDAIFDHGGAPILVINVASRTTAVAAATFTLPSSDIVYVGRQFSTVTSVTNIAGTTTYVAGTDYITDSDAGTVTRVVTGTIPSGSQIKIAYTFFDPTLVTPSDVIGTTTTTGKRTGIQGFLNAFAKYGLDPTILIAPSFSPLISVSTELIAMGDRIKAIVLLDAPLGSTRDEVLSGRNAIAPVQNFGTSNIRTMLCYPHLKRFDIATNAEALEPYSQRLAGVIARTDRDQGFWFSPSNKEILGVIGVERELSTSFEDANSDSNLLNSKGILTYLQTPGGGLRTWGNRSASYPTVTTPDNFLAVQRVRDIIAKGIRKASLQFLDRPINRGLIDAIRNTILGYFSEKTVQGALLPGSDCLFLAADNPPTAIAAGRLTFTTIILPPPPAERIVDKQVLDINLAAGLVA